MKNKQAILLLLPPFFLEKLQQLESECDRLCWDLSIAKVFSILNQLFYYLHGIFILSHQCDCVVLLYNFCKHSLRFDENIRNDLGRVDILVWCMFCCSYMGKDMQGGSTFSTGHGNCSWNSKLLQPGGAKNAAELLKDLAGEGIVREYAMEE